MPLSNRVAPLECLRLLLRHRLRLLRLLPRRNSMGSSSLPPSAPLLPLEPCPMPLAERPHTHAGCRRLPPCRWSRRPRGPRPRRPPSPARRADTSHCGLLLRHWPCRLGAGPCSVVLIEVLPCEPTDLLSCTPLAAASASPVGLAAPRSGHARAEVCELPEPSDWFLELAWEKLPNLAGRSCAGEPPSAGGSEGAQVVSWRSSSTGTRRSSLEQ